MIKKIILIYTNIICINAFILNMKVDNIIKEPLYRYWNCIGFENDIDNCLLKAKPKPYAFNIGEIPLVAWKNDKNDLIATLNACKHMGSKLDTGSICNGNLYCPYHGLKHTLDDACGIIKKHELTRPVKENDRVRHVECLNANAEPVFFSYRGKSSINEFVRHKTTETPEYNFIADDQIKHELWPISNTEDTKFITDAFKEVPYLYVADGHHRTAAAARIGKKRKEENPNHTGKEEYNYFLTVLFPDDELKIFDYNRLVKDLNGLSSPDFLTKLEDSFIVSQYGEGDPQPTMIREFSLYLEGKWYRLLAKDGCWDENDPVGDLDVTILSEKVLTPLLNIVDLRKDNRIDFVGGIRGLSELKRRVDSGEMVAAFALYPVTMEQLLTIADAGEIMPPKTTWFEPKLRSGLFVHDLE